MGGYDPQPHYCPPLGQEAGKALVTRRIRPDYRSWTDLECACKSMGRHIADLELVLRVERNRLATEMEHTLRLGVEVLDLQQANRRLEERLQFAQLKLGHRV